MTENNLTTPPSERPWTTYRFFNSKPDAFAETPIENYSCIESGHGLLCYGKDTEEGFPIVVLFDGQTDDPPTINIQEKAKIKFVYVATYSNVLLACCTNDTDYKFFLYNTSEPYEQMGMCSVKISKIPPLTHISVSPKIRRFAIKETETSLRLFEMPFTKKSSGCEIRTDDKITNHIMVSDYQLQRIIYVTTTTQVLAFYRLGRKKISKPQIMDDRGCQEGFCSTTTDGRLVVVRETEVSIYKDNQLYSTFFIEQVPKLIKWMKNSYLICCFNVPGSSSSVRIYNQDTHSTFGRYPDGDRVQQILIEWNSVILMLDDGSATKLTESNMQEKIQQLITNEQFDVALLVAKSQQLGKSLESEIHRQKGDSFFAKRMYPEAITEYKETIGTLEASYVITRFIDPQHAEFLVDYLEALSERNLETKQHTTLRFNCYTKLRKQEKLISIVDQCIKDAKDGKEPSFDLETAVSVLCIADTKKTSPNHQSELDYTEAALNIAKSYKMHSTYTKLLWESCQYDTIFEYLQGCETNVALSILRKYGSCLMQYCENKQAIVDFLVQACFEGLRAKPDSEEKSRMNPDDIVRIFLKYPQELYKFLCSLVAKFQSMNELKSVTKDTWNAIIELAVTLNHQEDAVRYFKLADGRFDSEQMLIMLKAEKCRYGLLLLYDFLGYYQEIILNSEDEEIPEVCAKYGPKDENLYRLGLQILSQHRNGGPLKRLVQVIADTNAIPFLAVYQILRKYEYANFGILKPVAKRAFRDRQKSIKELLEQYQTLENYISQKEDLTLDLIYDHFIAKQTRCNGCNKAIDLPVKHFLCGHSFHLRCLGDDLTKCPVCKEGQEQIVREKLESFRSASDYVSKNLPTEKNQYRFLDIVGSSQDYFSALSEAFACDSMNPDEDGEKAKEAQELLDQYIKS